MADYRTQTAQQVYQFLQHYIQTNGYPPSQQEIALGCHLSRTSVVQYLDWLEAKGRISRALGRARGILLITKP
jgi:repressor LexA